MTTIADRVNKTISIQLGAIAADIKPENHFANDLGADSMDKVELIMAFEDEFEIDIPDDYITDLTTVQQAIDYITGRVPA